MRPFATLIAALLVPASALAAGPRYLAPAEIDASLFLPAPPEPGSALAEREAAELRDVDSHRTAEALARAKADGETKDATIFAAAVGPGFDLAKLPATAALMADVRAEEKAAADLAKDHFLRTRPWLAVSGLHSCSTNDAPQSSYPSGHATMGYSMAVVLARMLPAKAPAIMARAWSYAESRIICEVHFRSDIVAGQVLGTMIAERLMRSPVFAAKLEAARSELVHAGL